MSEPTPPRSLHSLVEPDEFTRRHIGPSPDDVTAMLQVLGVGSVEALLSVRMPCSIRTESVLGLGGGV